MHLRLMVPSSPPRQPEAPLCWLGESGEDWPLVLSRKFFADSKVQPGLTTCSRPTFPFH